MRAKLAAFLIIGLTCAGCANDGPSTASLMALEQDIIHQKAIAAFGPESQWTPEQRAAYQAAVLQQQLQTMRELQQEKAYQRQQIAAAVGNGLKSAGDSIAASQTDPFILYKMNANKQSNGPGYRSWHNSDGSSGQYVPYPGGNGGTIFNSDGTITNVDPAIGH